MTRPPGARSRWALPRRMLPNPTMTPRARLGPRACGALAADTGAARRGGLAELAGALCFTAAAAACAVAGAGRVGLWRRRRRCRRRRARARDRLVGRQPGRCCGCGARSQCAGGAERAGALGRARRPGGGARVGRGAGRRRHERAADGGRGAAHAGRAAAGRGGRLGLWRARGAVATRRVPGALFLKLFFVCHVRLFMYKTHTMRPCGSPCAEATRPHAAFGFAPPDVRCGRASSHARTARPAAGAHACAARSQGGGNPDQRRLLLAGGEQLQRLRMQELVAQLSAGAAPTWVAPVRARRTLGSGGAEAGSLPVASARAGLP